MSFTHVFGDSEIIYAINSTAPTGELRWYKDMKRDGTNGAHAETGWAPHSGNQIGIGWGGFQHVFSGGDGVLYAIKATGELLWYRDIKRDGTNGAHAESGWAPHSGNQIGIGWGGLQHAFSGGGGVIYVIKATGELLWYKDLKRDGTNGPNAELAGLRTRGVKSGSAGAVFSTSSPVVMV